MERYRTERNTAERMDARGDILSMTKLSYICFLVRMKCISTEFLEWRLQAELTRTLSKNTIMAEIRTPRTDRINE